MAAPSAITLKVEMEFVPGSGTFVDITARVAGTPTINRPRTAPGQPATTTTLELQLYNHPATAAELTAWSAPAGAVGYCPFTPESPTAAFYPNIDRDRRVRVTYLWNAGANSSVRFFGWVDLWVPDAGDLPPGSAVVYLSASCVLSRYARRRTLSFLGEEMFRLSTNNTAYWPFDEENNSTTLRVSTKTATGPGTVYRNRNNNPGTIEFQSIDAGLLTDGQVTMTRGGISGDHAVILMPLSGSPVGLVTLGVKLAQDPIGASDTICSGYDAAGNLVWYFTASLVSDLIYFRIYDGTNIIQSEYATNSARDDGWRYFELRFTSATTTAINIRRQGDDNTNVVGGFGSFPVDCRNISYLTVGGLMSPARKGKIQNSLMGSVSGVSVHYTTAAIFGYAPIAIPGVVQIADDVADRIAIYGANIDALVGGSVGPATVDNTSVGYTIDNSNLLDMWNQHAITVGGRLTTLPNGQRSYKPSAETRLTTVALTLDAEQDLHAPAGGWSGIKDERPTRVTVSGQIGSLTTIDTVTEAATGLQLEGSAPTTSAADVSVLANVAGRILTAGATRLQAFGVEWTSTATDKTTAGMALVPGDRIRITTLPSSYLGYTQTDVYASGWREEFDLDQLTVSFTFDTDPADDPFEAVWDDSTTSRWGMAGSTVTGGTSLGNTGTGTAIITAPTDVLTTTGGEYSMDLNWNGERVTASGVGGGVSPQTATLSARGVAPSVARIHASGETVDVYAAFTWSP